MYLIECVNDNETSVLLDQRYDNDIVSAVLTLGYNIAGSLTVSLPYNHAGFNKIHGLSTLIKVYKISDSIKEWIFTGRVITADEDFYRTGTFVCEGILKMLCDSIVRKYEFQGTPADYVRQLISQHNSQVTEEKQFTIRTLDIVDVDSNNNIVRSSSQYPNTMSELSEKVIQSLGVYVTVEDVGSKYMIDIMQNINDRNKQYVELGENMINLTQTNTMSDIKTAIIPIGYEDEDGNKLTISDINGGVDFIYDQDAVNKYGVIVGTVEFEDVTVPENLLRKGRAYLKECISPKQTVEINAVDMALCNNDIKRIQLGWTRVQSAVHGINTDMLLTEMNIDLLNPSNNVYTLGATPPTSTSMNTSRMREISKDVQSIRTNISKQMQKAIDNATELITGAKGGYVLLDGDNNGYPERILIMDSIDKARAKNVIQLNKNGVGFSTKGINGPYENAWTIDGNLVADFITAGTMYADRIKGGTLTLGGKDNGSGKMHILNEKGEIIGKWDKDGISINAGAILADVIKGGTLTLGGINNASGKLNILDDTGGNVIGKWDKDGISINAGAILADVIKGGTLTLGGINNASGKLNILDDTGENVIGKWDKDGISIKEGAILADVIKGGTLQGVTIISEKDNHKIKLIDGEVKGYQNNKEVGSLDYSDGTRINGTLYPAMRMRAQQTMSIKTPRLCTAETGDETASVTTCTSGEIKVMTSSTTYKTLKFMNGFLVTGL